MLTVPSTVAFDTGDESATIGAVTSAARSRRASRGSKRNDAGGDGRKSMAAALSLLALPTSGPLLQALISFIHIWEMFLAMPLYGLQLLRETVILEFPLQKTLSERTWRRRPTSGITRRGCQF